MSLVIPSDIQRRAGIRDGDKIEFKVSKRQITIVAAPEDELSPAQRRAIDARLAKAQKGPYHGPFETAEEAIAFLSKEIRKRRQSKKPRK